MARHHGRFGKVVIGGTIVASIESWKLSMKKDKVDVTCFGDPNKVQVIGLGDFNGSYTGFWDDADTVPFTAQASSTFSNMILYVDYTNSVTKYAYGPAWIDMSIDTSVKDAVKISGDFVAAGAWYSSFAA